MRVLHVVPTFYPATHYGGPIYSTLQLCLNLQKIGCQVRVLTTDANGPYRLTIEQQQDPTVRELEVQYCRRLGKGMIAPQMVSRLSHEITWADLVHLTAVYNFPTIPTLLAARMRGKPLVWSPRGTLQRWRGSRHTSAKSAWESLCRAVLPRRAILHATCEEEAAESTPRLRKLPASIVPNGVDIPPLPPTPVNDSVLKLLYIGRLDPKKGLENLITAAGIISSPEVKSWTLTVAGAGSPEYVNDLRKLAEHAGVTHLVHFVGELQGPAKYQAFASCDVVVVPSHTENFAIVVAEALAHSRPVIASRGTPWKEVEARKCGLWVDNAPPSLARAITQIAHSDRIAMGLVGREWMSTNFSWQEQAQSMLSLYERLVRS